MYGAGTKAGKEMSGVFGGFDPSQYEEEARQRWGDTAGRLSKCLYECSPEIHAGLGAMYVADPRFRETIDRAGAGLAAYMSEAIAANAAT